LTLFRTGLSTHEIEFVNTRVNKKVRLEKIPFKLKPVENSHYT